MQNNELNQQREKLEIMYAKSRKMKKRVFFVMRIIVGVVLILFLAVFLIDAMKNKEPQIPDYGFEFYPPYEGNIMENEEYLDLRTPILYTTFEGGYRVTQSITDENRADFSDSVLFLCDYIDTVIAGDVDGYQRYFNEEYYRNNERLTAFNPQMIYNAEIIFLSETSEENGDRLLTYQLEYMIYRNDGSFRSDVDSNSIRPQEILIRITPDQRIAIEQIVTKYQDSRS